MIQPIQTETVIIHMGVHNEPESGEVEEKITFRYEIGRITPNILFLI